ncbi:MAG: hypothetical protein JW735_02725 [Prolixibacteraceae bacterium]|nr:hypothetical protein [Prolixibacteraceae bacterium]
MKRGISVLLICFVVSVFFLSSCFNIFEGGISKSKGPLFLVGCTGNSSEGLEAGLYLLSIGKTSPSLTFVTEYRPWAYSIEKMDYNNGRIAFSVERSLVPEGESGIAYMDVDDIENVMFAPIPTAPVDHYYAIPDERPRVFSDGRIAYRVVLNTDNPYDDAHSGVLAIYNPKSGDIELSGGLSGFISSQPEKGHDTEAGSMGADFVLSADERFVYCTAYGFGTDWGVYHVDYKFVVEYEVGNPGMYSRIAQTSSIPTAVTGDGNYLILSGSGLQKVDLSTNVLTQVDDYSNMFNPGQVSKSSSRMFKVWRGSGLGEFDWNQDSFLHIIDGGEITNSPYRGLGHGGQYSTDESIIYFTGSTDFYTNYASDLIVFSTPKVEVNATPDSLTTIPAEYCTRVFLLLDD